MREKTSWQDTKPIKCLKKEKINLTRYTTAQNCLGEFLKGDSKNQGKTEVTCQHTCKKCARTMFIYMSSSSLPLPMKQRCSPPAMEPDSMDCFCASSRDFTDCANSDGFWSIQTIKKIYCGKLVFSTHPQNLKYFRGGLEREQCLYTHHEN